MSSFLLPLKVEGAGTAQAECFASYFGRLAYVHALSRSQLTRLLASWRSTQTGAEFRICETPVYATKGSGLFGYRERTETYVSLVEAAVGSDTIRRTTLIPIRPSLAPQCANSVKSRRAWCEACFVEDLKRTEIPYDRFLWTLTPTQRCHLHRLRLRQNCPSCGSDQRFHHKSGNPLLCVKCGSDLIGPVSKRIPECAPAFGESDCIDIVASIAIGSITQTTPDALLIFERTLDSIVSPLAGVVRDISEKNGSARATMKNVRPSLTTLMKKAFATGVRVVDLLTDPTGAAMAAGQLFYDRHQIPVSVRPNHGDWVRMEAETRLKELLRKPRTEQIPPLSEVARELAVSESYIRRQFPSLVERYQSHRMAANIAQTARKQAQCRAELERIAACTDGPIWWSRKKEIEAHLVSSTGCTYPMARLAISQASRRFVNTAEGQPTGGSNLLSH